MAKFMSVAYVHHRYIIVIMMVKVCITIIGILYAYDYNAYKLLMVDHADTTRPC